MTRLNKNRKEQAVEEIIESQSGLCEYPFDKDFHYDNWWNQFRGPLSPEFKSAPETEL